MMRLRRRKAAAAPPTPEQQATRQRISRRRFLKIGGAAGVGLMVVCVGGGAGVNYLRANFPSMLAPALTSDPNAWLRIEADGRVRLMVNKIEIGQGITTAAVQIIADELDVPFSRVELVPADTTQLPYDLGTAGAAARQTLLKLAADRTGKPIERFTTRDGQIILSDDESIRFSYGELVAGQRLLRVITEPLPNLRWTKAPAEYSIVGRSAPRLDIPAKVTGQAVYGYDVQIEGMLHGRVARPPVLGATISSVNLEPARGLPGVVALVHEGNFVGVAAETSAQAAIALSAIEIAWRQPSALTQQAEVEAMLEPDDASVLRDTGNVTRALAQARRRISAEYRTSFATHAAMEPQSGVADVRADHAMVWTATQAPFEARRQVAAIVGLDEEQVTVTPTLVGGGFGRKTINDAANEAARLSKAAGRPVRVGWNRGEEFSLGYMRPPTVTRLEGGLDAQGRITAWRQQLATGLVMFSFLPSILRLILGNDFGATRGALGPYSLPNHRVTASFKDLPVKTGTWRGLGSGPNAFAVEQFIDELAVAAGSDPLQFRLHHLGSDPASLRMRRVLETAARQIGWGAPLPPNTGRGIACGEDVGTFVAEAAEVEVDRTSGAVRVTRVAAAIDCGLAINPDGVTAQVEGGIMMGLSAALREEITLKDGAWQAATFGEYPIFTIADAPEIAVTLIDNRETAPSGVGEPPLMPIAAAIGNAIANAVGARVRTMPMTPERVLAALREG
jgi:isoquinoline 1-oxidoreductase beta subunit